VTLPNMSLRSRETSDLGLERGGNNPPSASNSPAGARNPQSIWAWYAAGIVIAVVVAWLASLVHLTGYAPVGIISIVVGLALGGALGFIARYFAVRCRNQLIVGAIVLALATVAAEHSWLYASFRRQWHEARFKSPHVAMFRAETPWSPREYFAHEMTSQAAALWTLDALLIAATAGASTLVVSSRSSPSPPAPSPSPPTS
jgi:hypothetical protein